VWDHTEGFYWFVCCSSIRCVISLSSQCVVLYAAWATAVHLLSYLRELHESWELQEHSNVPLVIQKEKKGARSGSGIDCNKLILRLCIIPGIRLHTSIHSRVSCPLLEFFCHAVPHTWHCIASRRLVTVTVTEDAVCVCCHKLKLWKQETASYSILLKREQFYISLSCSRRIFLYETHILLISKFFLYVYLTASVV
jgi:hypothetical protein